MVELHLQQPAGARPPPLAPSPPAAVGKLRLTGPRRVLIAALALENHLHPRLFRWFLGAVLRAVVADRQVLAPYGVLTLPVDLSEGCDREIYRYAYDPPVVNFLRTALRPGDLYVDIGANAGVLVAEAANGVGPDGMVLAIEPNPRLAGRLREAAGNCPAPRIEVLNLAVGDQEGKLPFYLSSSHPYSSLLREALPDYPIDSVIEVEVRTLDTVMREVVEPLAADQPFRVLKVDAQGMETRILTGGMGMLAERPPDFIVIEMQPGDLDPTAGLLAPFGYTPNRLLETGALVALGTQPSMSEDVVFARHES